MKLKRVICFFLAFAIVFSFTPSVSAAKYNAVKTISVNGSLKVDLGGRATSKVVWKSSNPKIAYVAKIGGTNYSKALIKGKTKGAVLITAKVKKKKYKIKLIVKPEQTITTKNTTTRRATTTRKVATTKAPATTRKVATTQKATTTKAPATTQRVIVTTQVPIATTTTQATTEAPLTNTFKFVDDKDIQGIIGETISLDVMISKDLLYGGEGFKYDYSDSGLIESVGSNNITVNNYTNGLYNCSLKFKLLNAGPVEITITKNNLSIKKKITVIIGGDIVIKAANLTTETNTQATTQDNVTTETNTQATTQDNDYMFNVIVNKSSYNVGESVYYMIEYSKGVEVNVEFDDHSYFDQGVSYVTFSPKSTAGKMIYEQGASWNVLKPGQFKLKITGKVNGNTILKQYDIQTFGEARKSQTVFPLPEPTTETPTTEVPTTEINKPDVPTISTTQAPITTEAVPYKVYSSYLESDTTWKEASPNKTYIVFKEEYIKLVYTYQSGKKPKVTIPSGVKLSTATSSISADNKITEIIKYKVTKTGKMTFTIGKYNYNFTSDAILSNKRVKKGKSVDIYIGVASDSSKPTWSVADKSIATIKSSDNYKATIKGVKKGTTKVKVKFGSKTYSAELEVY